MSRWRRPCAASAARWSWSRPPHICSPASPRRWAKRWARCCAATGSNWSWACRRPAARRDGADYVLVLDDGSELRGDHLLVATGRRPRVTGSASRRSASRRPHGIPVDAHLRAGEGLWAIGDVTGVRLLTHVGKYQGEVVAANILGEPREANYDAIPDVVYTDPQAASVGAHEAPFSATTPLSEVAKTATYTHAYAESNGFLTLLSDGERLTGAYGLGPEAGEWLQQATLAIRARCRSTCCATPSSRSPPSPRSTSQPCKACAWPHLGVPQPEDADGGAMADKQTGDHVTDSRRRLRRPCSGESRRGR